MFVFILFLIVVCCCCLFCGLFLWVFWVVFFFVFLLLFFWGWGLLVRLFDCFCLFLMVFSSIWRSICFAVDAIFVVVSTTG